MKIERKVVEKPVVFLALRGKVTLGEGTMALHNAVREELKQGIKRIVLDLSDVNFIDASGIGELVNSFMTVSNKGGKLVLLNPIKKIEELLTITKLLTVFIMVKTEQEALAVFSA